MADEIAAFGVAVPVKIDGQEYRFSPLRLSDSTELQAVYAGKRLSSGLALAQTAATLPDGAREPLMAKAVERIEAAERFSMEDLEQWIRTPEGAVQAIWRMLRVNHPEFDSVDKAAKVLDTIPAEVLKVTLEQLTGTKAAKN